MFFVIAFGFLLLYFWFKNKFLFWERRGFPSVPGSIPFGSVAGLGTKFHTSVALKSFYDEYKEKAPVVGFYFFTKPVLLLTDPELLKEIFVKSFEAFNDRGIYWNPKDDPMTNHVFFSNETAWKNMRTMTSPSFSSDKIELMFDSVAESCDRLIDFLKPSAELGENLEMKEILSSLTTEVIMSVAFGLETKCLGNPASEFRQIAKRIFNPPPLRLAKIGFINLFPDVGRFFKMTINDAETRKFFTEMVDKTIKHRQINRVMRNDFLQSMIQLKESQGISLDEVVANCFMFFMAGKTINLFH